MSKVILDWKTATNFVTDAFEKVGVPRDEAEICTDVLLEADKRGIESHGCNRFKPIYLDRIKIGIQNPKTFFEIIKETETTAVIDGHDGMGQVIGYKAMKMAIAKAKKHGMGMVVVRNSCHYGFAGYYAEMAAKAGCISFNGTNARPSVAPTFGVEGILGTNPLTIGVPSDEKFDFIIDCATSITQNGKLEYYARIGQPVKPGTVIDENGEPYEGDAQIALDRIRKGTAALTPLGGIGEELGGYKGYGYAVAVEVLSAALQDGEYGKVLSGLNEKGEKVPYHLGHFFLAIDTDHFLGEQKCRKITGDILRKVRASKKQPGHDKIFTAGEKEYLIFQQRKNSGVPINQSVQKEMNQIRDELNLKYVFPWEKKKESQNVNILIFNCSNSTLTSKVIEFDKNNKTIEPKCLFFAKAQRLNMDTKEKPFIEYHLKTKERDDVVEHKKLNHSEASVEIMKFLNENGIKIDFIGHRIVHHGGQFEDTIEFTNNKEICKKLKDIISYAPLHNPHSVAVIEECNKFYGKNGINPVRQYLTFDSSFHKDYQPGYCTFAIDQNIAKTYKLKKYGFHGLSYKYCNEVMEDYFGTKKTGKMICCHLSNSGSSCSAFIDGKTIDTSMGYGTLNGLVMGTRSGDIDPSVVVSLMRDRKMSPQECENFLAKKGGLLGITRGFTSDLLDCYRIGFENIGNYTDNVRQDCKLAFEVYVNRLVSKIGGLVAEMNGIDIVCFSGDLGLNIWQLREVVCKRLGYLGVLIDYEENKKTAQDKGQLTKNNMAIIQDKNSRVKVFVIKTDEEMVIAKEGKKFFD